jgi:hypothetical protein
MRKKLQVLEMTPPLLDIFYATIPSPDAIPGRNPGASMDPLLLRAYLQLITHDGRLVQGTPC